MERSERFSTWTTTHLDFFPTEGSNKRESELSLFASHPRGEQQAGRAAAKERPLHERERSGINILPHCVPAARSPEQLPPLSFGVLDSITKIVAFFCASCDEEYFLCQQRKPHRHTKPGRAVIPSNPSADPPLYVSYTTPNMLRPSSKSTTTTTNAPRTGSPPPPPVLRSSHQNDTTQAKRTF